MKLAKSRGMTRNLIEPIKLFGYCLGCWICCKPQDRLERKYLNNELLSLLPLQESNFPTCQLTWLKILNDKFSINDYYSSFERALHKTVKKILPRVVASTCERQSTVNTDFTDHSRVHGRPGRRSPLRRQRTSRSLRSDRPWKAKCSVLVKTDYRTYQNG